MSDRAGLRLRPGGPDDAASMAVTVAAGFATYRAFAPAGWEPPSEISEHGFLTERLADPATWCAVVEDSGGEQAGHVAVVPARAGREPAAELLDGLAHVWQLFVREPWWGTGVATRLNAAALGAARERGYEEMRLYTPEAHTRARAFYEREGWRVQGDPIADAALGLALLEYRIAL